MKRKRNGLMILALVVMSIGIVFFIVGTESKVGKQHRDGEDDRTSIVYPNDTEQVKKLEISMHTTPAQYHAFKRLSEPLESKYEWLTVNVVNEAVDDLYVEDVVSQFKKKMTQGEAPDVLLIDNRAVIPLASEGYLLALDEQIPTDNDMDPLLKTLRWNESVWGMPWEADPYVIVWHPAGLKKNGLEELPRSEEELMLLQEHLAEKSIQGSLFVMDPNDVYATIALLNVWDEGISFASSELIDGSTIDDSIWTSLLDGQYAMLVTRTSMLTEQHKRAGYKMEPLHGLSTHSLQEEGWIGGKSFVVSATTMLQQEALDWLQQVVTLDDSAVDQPIVSSFKVPTISELQQLVDSIEQFWDKKITAEELRTVYLDWFTEAQAQP